MHLFLLKPRGFCAGVKRAIATVEKALEIFGPPIYVKHQIVHNQHVVRDLENKGAVFIEDLASVPEKSKIIYSAHGVAPSVRKEARKRKLIEIDATCVLVTKSHIAAKEYAEKGYKILLIGHKNHIEVIGIQKEAEAATTVIESLEDAEKLSFSEEEEKRLFYLTQTTLSVDKTRKIIDALKKKYPRLKTLPSSSICYATANRQKALASILDKVDLAFVIGDPKSSNSNRLKEIAQQKVRAYLINQEEEITAKLLENTRNIALTAGASTPENVVQKCIRRLQSFGVKTIKDLSYAQEDVNFPLPKEILLNLN